MTPSEPQTGAKIAGHTDEQTHRARPFMTWQTFGDKHKTAAQLAVKTWKHFKVCDYKEDYDDDN